MATTAVSRVVNPVANINKSILVLPTPELEHFSYHVIVTGPNFEELEEQFSSSLEPLTPEPLNP